MRQPYQMEKATDKMEQTRELRDQRFNAATTQKPDEQRMEKEGLLICPQQSSENPPHHTVNQMLKPLTTPHELGLTAIEIKPVRGGAVILSISKEGWSYQRKKFPRTLKLLDSFRRALNRTQTSPDRGNGGRHLRESSKKLQNRTSHQRQPN